MGEKNRKLNQPWYKLAWSYFDDVLIESTSSDYNEELYLLLVKGRYQLVTDSVIYSFGDKYYNFAIALNHIQTQTVKSCLILGFGLGSIVDLLEKNHNVFPSITGVEIDEVIIDLAERYTIPNFKSKIELVHYDAYLFIDDLDASFDLICLDIFINKVIPQRFLSLEFIKKMAKLKSSAGTLIMNCLYTSETDKAQTDYFYNTIFEVVFPKAKMVQTKGNLMLLSS